MKKTIISILSLLVISAFADHHDVMHGIAAAALTVDAVARLLPPPQQTVVVQQNRVIYSTKVGGDVYYSEEMLPGVSYTIITTPAESFFLSHSHYFHHELNRWVRHEHGKPRPMPRHEPAPFIKPHHVRPHGPKPHHPRRGH